MIGTVTAAGGIAPLGAGTCSHFEDITCSIPMTKLGNRSTSDLTNLDLLRSIAVGLVFIGHMMGMMRIRGLGDIGHFGVLLFLFIRHLSLCCRWNVLAYQAAGCTPSLLCEGYFEFTR